jgi:hypothetical protein
MADENSPVDNLVEKPLLVVQQLGDQLAIIPLICCRVQAMGSGTSAAPLELAQQLVGGNALLLQKEMEVSLHKTKGRGLLQVQDLMIFGSVSDRLILKHYFFNNSNFNRGWKISTRRLLFCFGVGIATSKISTLLSRELQSNLLFVLLSILLCSREGDVET